VSPQVVVLAAGQGKRMHSDLPKVLHPLAGRALLSHVLATARTLEPRRLCVVVGHGADAIRAHISDPDVSWALQEQQLGTGHAVLQAVPQLEEGGTVVVLYGDVPLISPATLRALLAAARDDRLALLTQELEQPRGYGRIVRDPAGRVTRIVEEKDATESERAIRRYVDVLRLHLEPAHVVVVNLAGIHGVLPDRHQAPSHGQCHPHR